MKGILPICSRRGRRRREPGNAHADEGYDYAHLRLTPPAEAPHDPLTGANVVAGLTRGPGNLASDILAFTRGESFTCIVNLSATPVQLPDDAQILVSSQPLSPGVLPVDTSVWLRTA